MTQLSTKESILETTKIAIDTLIDMREEEGKNLKEILKKINLSFIKWFVM